MKTFHEKEQELRNEVLSYITEVLKKRGTNYELVDPAEYNEEDGFTEEFYDLPRGYIISKHDYYIQYGIIIINIDTKTDKLTFVGLEVFEDNEQYEFSDIELSTEVLCHIGDIVKKLES